MDNDVHGHVNSVVHYSLFDTAVNASVGRSSVRDAVGLFTAAAPHAAAEGFFVHVYVDRAGRRPVALPHDGRGALQRIAN